MGTVKKWVSNPVKAAKKTASSTWDKVESAGQATGHALAKTAPYTLGTLGMIFGGPALAGLGSGVGTTLDRVYNDDKSWGSALKTGAKAGLGTGAALTGIGMGLNALEGIGGSAGLDFSGLGIGPTAGSGGTLASLGSYGSKILGGLGSVLGIGQQAATSLFGGSSISDLAALGLPVAAVAALANQAKPNTVTGMTEQETAGAAAAKAAAQAGDIATLAVDAYKMEKLQPYQQQAVNNFTQQATAQMKQNFANLGLTGSTMESTMAQNIALQANTLADSYHSVNFNNAITALTTTGNLDQNAAYIYSTLAQEKIDQNKDYQDAISAAAAIGAQLFGYMNKGSSSGDGDSGGGGGLWDTLSSIWDWATGGSGTIDTSNADLGAWIPDIDTFGKAGLGH